MAEEGIRALARALPALHADAERSGTRAHDALYGAWLCGAVLGHVAMGLHHKLCHTLGGSFNLPHAETHTVVLPHALAYNAAAAPQAMARIARALAAPTVAIRCRRHALACTGRAPRRTDRAARHRHAGRRAGPRGRPRGADALPEPAPARTCARCARCCSAPTTARRRKR